MDFENEKKPEEMLNEQNAGSREGYQTSGQTGNYQGYRTPGRSPRPRIHQPRPYTSQRPGYNKGGNDDGGFRPEGFGTGLQSGNTQQRQYRPRYNNNNADGGYQQRGYNNNRGGYGQQGGYNNRGGNYRPRYNNGGEGEENTGYQQNGYGQQGGYNNNRNGYQQRGYNNNRNGYGQQGGYNNNRNGYQQRGGYNNNRNGYGQQGGYNNNRNGYRQRSADYDQNAKYSFKKRIEYKEENYDPNEPIRLNKFLANAGVCSRREADEFIQAGVVSVNGNVVTELGTKVMRTDEVKFHDQTVNIEKKVYVLLNKPKDYVTTSDDPQQRKTVMDIVKNACSERIYPVGRLDRNTTGVLLLTNDGDLVALMLMCKR